MQDRGDVGQIVEHLEGVVDILCRCSMVLPRHSPRVLLEAAHKSSGYSSWRCPKNSSSLTTFSCLMNTVSRCRCPLPHHIPFLFSLHSASPRGGGLSPIPTPGLGLHKRFVGFGWGSSGLRLSYRAVRDGSRDYGLNIDGCGLRGSTRDYLKLDRAGDKS